MNPMDTLIWLLNFPVGHAYPTVFIAGFSLMGLGVLSFRGVGGANPKLTAMREREGLPEARSAGGVGHLAARVQRFGFRILAVVMVSGLVMGILALTGVPLTRAYIHENGVPTTGSMDGDWVTFSTAGGQTFTIESNFFSPAVYPDTGAWVSSDAPVVVRYLPSHPQAFVIDTTQLPQ
ncbi:hypothetical protein GCM10027421_29590 [Microbacterium shaanxiense]